MGDPSVVLHQLEVVWPLDHYVEAGMVSWLDFRRRARRPRANLRRYFERILK
jgi:hypothetical protein